MICGVCIYLGGYTYAHQVHIRIETGVRCYTSASWRQLKGYWVSEDSLSLFRSHVFPIYSQLLSGKCTEALCRDSCCYSILEGLCFPITEHGSDTIWQARLQKSLQLTSNPVMGRVWTRSKEVEHFVLLLYTSKFRHLALSVFLFSTVLELWVKAYLYYNQKQTLPRPQ